MMYENWVALVGEESSFYIGATSLMSNLNRRILRRNCTGDASHLLCNKKGENLDLWFHKRLKMERGRSLNKRVKDVDPFIGD